METKFTQSLNGMSPQTQDLNMIADEAALADDRVLAEILRIQPYKAGTGPAKLVLPFTVGRTIQGAEGDVTPGSATVLEGTATATDVAVRVRPFRAIIGSRSAPASATADQQKEWWRDIRTAAWTGADALHEDIDLDDVTPSAGPRVDLVYARVDVDLNAAAVARKVKAATGEVSSQNLAIYSNTTVTVGVEKGTDGSLTRPALPTDTADTYYIALAYVYLRDNGSGTAIMAFREVAESPAFVSGDCRPGTGAFDPDGYGAVTDIDNVAAGAAHLPPTMLGKVERFFQFVWGVMYPSPPVGITELDDSIDYRNRLIKVSAFAQNVAEKHDFWAISSAGLPSSAADSANYYRLTYLRPGTEFPTVTGDDVELLIHKTTGNLAVSRGADDPSSIIYLWLEMTGQKSV